MTRQADLLVRLREYLFPHEAEKDQAFRREIRRLSRRALYVMGVITVMMALIIYPTIAMLMPFILGPLQLIGPGIAVAVVAGLLFWLARSRLGLRHGRLLALLITWLACALGTVFDVSLATEAGFTDKFVLADTLGAMLMAVVLIPALPVQIFYLGFGINATYLIAYRFSPAWQSGDHQGWVTVALVLVFYTLFCPVLAAVNYQRLWSSHRSHAEVLRAQRNLLLTENAASMGRVAAALSHELNNPLGALKSAIATLGRLPERFRSADAAELPKLERVREQLQTSAGEAVDRLDHFVHRVQRFTNLDRGELRDVDVRDLIDDVVALIDRDQKPEVDLQVESSSLPSIVCKPQQLTAVLSRVIQDAVNSVPRPGHVRIGASRQDSSIAITVHDNRPRISAGQLTKMFEPDFRATGGRMAAANWDWFHSRQIVRENGGELKVVSKDASTTTTITLPIAGVET